jgi:ABC-2 type transport system ATP-binding protein
MSEGAETPAILAEGACKRYGSLTAVDHLDISVRRGEVFCLFGPNGSGKTT